MTLLYIFLINIQCMLVSCMTVVLLKRVQVNVPSQNVPTLYTKKNGQNVNIKRPLFITGKKWQKSAHFNICFFNFALVIKNGERGSSVVSTLASGARGPRFDPR